MAGMRDLTNGRVENMLIYLIFLCAVVVMTYLTQFLVYRYAQHPVPGTDLVELTGLPGVIEFECELAVKLSDSSM